MATPTVWLVSLLTAKAVGPRKVKVKWKRSNPEAGQIKIVLKPPIPYPKQTLLDDEIKKGTNVLKTETFATRKDLVDGSEVTCELFNQAGKVMARAAAIVEM